jgi:hypothetical protein
MLRPIRNMPGRIWLFWGYNPKRELLLYQAKAELGTLLAGRAQYNGDDCEAGGSVKTGIWQSELGSGTQECAYTSTRSMTAYAYVHVPGP